MKWYNKLLISLLIIALSFFAFYNPKKINLEGSWKTKKIVLDGKEIYPDNLSKLILIDPEIVINNWSKSIFIPINRKNIEAELNYIESNNSNLKLSLHSTEKSLNGIYNVTIDTSEIKPQSYTVDVKLKSHKNLIYFQKNVIIHPWKPGPHRRGTPY